MIAALEHPPEAPLPDRLVFPQLLEEAAGKDGRRPFVTDVFEHRMTYEDLHRRSLTWATALEDLGVSRGDTVAVLVRNSAEALALWLGIAWLGAIEVSINNEYRGRMLTHALNTCGAKLGIVEADFLTAIATVGEGLESLRSLIVIGEEGKGVPLGRLKVFIASEVLVVPKIVWDRKPPAPHDIACGIYTSGTTGPSKCVLLPWAQLYASATGTLPPGDLDSGDCLYIHGPNYHIGGKALPYLMALVDGRVGIRPRFSRSKFWPDIARFQATVTTLGAATTKWILDHEAEPEEPRTLRRVMMAPLTPLSSKFARRFGVQTYTCYSMTELSMPFVGVEWDQEEWRSCGRLRPGWPGYEARLVDEHDYEVEPGKVGELVVRTRAPWALTAGYLNAPDKTAAAWRNGWFHTGDCFRRDEAGNYYFVDRLKDAIRRRGENISSYEVEAEVLAHPEVLECAAVAVPADDGEDEVKVAVVLKPEAKLEPADLVLWLIPRVPRFMVPRYVEIVASLPRTPTQKVQKSALKGVGPSVWDREAAGLEVPR